MRINLIKLRGEKTLTQVAEEIGVTRQMLGAIERGDRTPSLKLAKRIASYYGTIVEEIF